MKTFVIAVLAALALQVMASSTPEEMYGMYDKDGKYRELTEQEYRQVSLFENEENNEQKQNQTET